MIFKTLTIQNFLSIHNITLDLQDRGLTLIKGVNKDNPEFDNNGSGKSSMIEALVYVLYGRTLRGLKGDAVVHNIPKKNMKIFLDLVDDDGTEYRIARYRKHSTNKNKSLLYRNGKDITPKSEADFNDYIANLLQADYMTFTSSLLYSQESFKFTSATDAEMKATFDLMLGLDVFSKCLEITKSRIKEVEFALSSAEWKIKDREDKILSSDEQIEETSEKETEYEKDKAERIEVWKNTIISCTSSLKQYEQELKQLQEQLSEQEQLRNKLQKALESKRSKLKKVDELKDALSELKREISSHEHEIKRCNSEISREQREISNSTTKISTLEKKIEKFVAEKDNLDKDIGQPCPTCGQPITEKSLEPAKQEYDEKIQGVNDDVLELSKQIKSSEKTIESLNSQIESLNSQIESLKGDAQEFETLIQKSKKLVVEKDECEEAVDAAKEEYFGIKSKVTEKQSQITHTEERIIEVKDEISRLEKEKNPYTEIIKQLKKDIEDYNAEISELKQSTQDKQDEKQCLMFWQQAYSNQGIKSLILDDITPFLNRRVNKYLSKLTSGHIEVKFSTQTTLKSGETREKFSIDITNQDGGDEYISNSGGEKKRIDLAINLALQDLVSSRSTKRLSIAIFDEIFDALDQTGIEKVVELLQELSSEKSTIFVISHNEHLQSYFDNVVTVVKENGYSTLLNGSSEQEEQPMCED